MPSLNHFYKFLKSTLVRLIQDEANNPSNLMRPNSDFSRTRKLSIEDLAAVSFQTDDRSINRSLPFLPESLAQVSLSAITQARKKIKSSLFSNVFSYYMRVIRSGRFCCSISSSIPMGMLEEILARLPLELLSFSLSKIMVGF